MGFAPTNPSGASQSRKILLRHNMRKKSYCTLIRSLHTCALTHVRRRRIYRSQHDVLMPQHVSHSWISILDGASRVIPRINFMAHSRMQLLDLLLHFFLFINLQRTHVRTHVRALTHTRIHLHKLSSPLKSQKDITRSLLMAPGSH